MKSRLTSLLTILSVGITALAFAYLNLGAFPAIAVGIVSALALGAWLSQSFRIVQGHDAGLSPYIMTVFLTLVLATCRHLSGFALTMGEQLNIAAHALSAIAMHQWLAWFVAAPVSLMLLGSYFLSRRTPLGLYLAWWTAVYAILDGSGQLWLELGSGRDYRHLYYIAVPVAILQIVSAVYLASTLVRMGAVATVDTPVVHAMTARGRNLWTLLFASFIVVYASMVFTEAGFMPLAILTGSMGAGLVAWRKTTALYPADPAVAVPLYLLLLALFYVHVGEEALTAFNRGIAALTGKPWSDWDFTLLIGLLGPAVWIFAAWSLWRRQPFGNFIFWFFIIGMIVGEPTHLIVFPVLAMKKFGIGYEYFSGMYTALFPMIPAIVALTIIVRAHRQRVAVR